MPNITDKERVRRLQIVSECLDNGLTDYQIAKKMSLPIETVKRTIGRLEELRAAELSPEEVAEKRSELYLKLSDAAAEAIGQYEIYKTPIRCPKCKGEGFVIETKKKRDIEVLCTNCKGLGWLHDPINSNRFLVTWSNILEKIAKLYGLDNVRQDGITFNQQNVLNNVLPGDKIDAKTGEKITKLVIEAHENSRK